MDTVSTQEYETLPVAVVERMVRVCRFVSMGRGYIGEEPYPDSLARSALGALGEYRDQNGYSRQDICELPHLTVEEEAACDRARLIWGLQEKEDR